MSYRRAENEDGNYAKGFRAVCAGLCGRVLDRICTLGGDLNESKRLSNKEGPR